MNTSLDGLITKSDAEQQETTQQFEERADQLELTDLLNNTVLAAESEGWIRALTGIGAKLLIGPRGCGKTHLMRYAYSQCIENDTQPFAIYVTFNRYWHLEPALRRNPGAITSFYTWVIANILLGLHAAVRDHAKALDGTVDADLLLEVSQSSLSSIVGTLEKSRTLSIEEDDVARTLTIDRAKNLLLRTSMYFGRKRVVLFLDDAALVLAKEYMAKFFDIFRVLKSSHISPKASVYPGTTEYGDTFSPAHESSDVNVWKSVDDQNYLEFMKGIVRKRSTDTNAIPQEILELLAYAAFGVPRSCMVLVRDYNAQKQAHPGDTPQAIFNRVIAAFCNYKIEDYRALSRRLPQLRIIAETGQILVEAIVKEVAEDSKKNLNQPTRRLVVGIQADGLTSPYLERMLGLLAEMGLLYRHGVAAVSHGDRSYFRFTPHLALLIQQRAFSAGGGFSPRLAVDVLKRPDEKHPVRRSVSTLLSETQIKDLRLDLPNCASCGNRRDEDAKFCKYCGAKLSDVSAFEACMNTPLWEVPSLTIWQREKIKQSPEVPKTIGAFLALADRNSPLRTIKWIGEKRAEIMIEVVETFVDEFFY